MIGEEKDKRIAPIATLPFNYCSLSLCLLKTTCVRTNDGIVFDLVNIIPFIKNINQILLLETNWKLEI